MQVKRPYAGRTILSGPSTLLFDFGSRRHRRSSESVRSTSAWTASLLRYQTCRVHGLKRRQKARRLPVSPL